MKLHEIQRRPLQDAEGFYTDEKSIKDWLLSKGFKYPEDKLKVNADGIVDVDGDVSVINADLLDGQEPKGDLKVKFGKVTGSFSLANFGLSTLKGAPFWVGKNVNFSRNKLLKSFKGGPKKIGGWLGMSDCSLETFEDFPQNIYGSLYLSNNNLTAFGNDLITVYGEIYIEQNPFKTLDGIENQLAFSIIPIRGQAAASLYLGVDAYPSGVLSILNISGTLYDIIVEGDGGDFKKACKIVQNHLKDRSIFECQSELIEAGLEEFI